jgi:hypothetical protein
MASDTLLVRRGVAAEPGAGPVSRPGKILIGRFGHERTRLDKGEWPSKETHGCILEAPERGQRLQVREAKGF